MYDWIVDTVNDWIQCTTGQWTLCICSRVGTNAQFDLLLAAAFNLWLQVSIKQIISDVYRFPALLLPLGFLVSSTQSNQTLSRTLQYYVETHLSPT